MDPQRIDRLKTVMLTLAGVIAVLAVFQTGVFVGYRKAAYSCHWGEHRRPFFEPRMGFMGPPPGPPGDGPGRDAYMGGHGLEGTVTKIDGDSLIVTDLDGDERTVVMATGTAVKPSDSDMSTGSHVVILGAPDDVGNIEARFIRITPSTH